MTRRKWNRSVSLFLAQACPRGGQKNSQRGPMVWELANSYGGRGGRREAQKVLRVRAARILPKPPGKMILGK